MGSFQVKSGSGNAYSPNYLTDIDGNNVIDPTWNIEYRDKNNIPVVAQYGRSYAIYDNDGNKITDPNTNDYMVAPDYLSDAQGFSKTVNNAKDLPNASYFQEASMLYDYFAATNTGSSFYLPSISNIQSFILFGPGNPQLNPTGNQFTTSIISPFTAVASYELGAIAATRDDGLALIQQAGSFNSSFIGGKNTFGYNGNSEKDTVEYLAGIQAVEMDNFLI